ncbi:CoA pyrophosphatase [Aurantimonas sp. MSK8Z-1]|uniref:CoA pyrophosphatase n=1 Tax=Mangrovibrevibacter kandeliae TaxID=2968473 RepID=UPI00211872B5|nr:CoA pyrophosphatase [Aurantimonas sp. MSK8Z-1]MCW4113781.1 CoA pyrophosphatase [Aurantimonas sp. MSK8Z-1]
MTLDLSGFTAADFRRRVALRGATDLEVEIGDHLLNPDMDALIDRAGAREAAVLVPIVDRPEGASVLLTTRTATLRKHSGQIAFPGGSIDPDDVSPEAAALRESFEEIALPAEHVETVGRLPRYLTTTGFRITPILAVVTPGFTLTPNPDEVADSFEVPLGFLMNPANHRCESRIFKGRERFFYTMPYETRMIWGITAGIIRTLYERLYR